MRVVLSVIFLLASGAYLLTLQSSTHIGRIAFKVQIIPSLLSMTIGATAVWLALTFLLGRVYCSTVCPIGTLQDVFIRLFRPLTKKKDFSFRKARRYRYDLLLVYVICLLCSVAILPMLLEPWNIYENIIEIFDNGALDARWSRYFVNSWIGIGIGLLSIIVLVAWSAFRGRGFCKEACPIGTALSLAARYSVYHIEIDGDKCVSCMKCEEVCKSECIKVVSRYVDDKECVRCINCLTVCDNDAIHLQKNRNRAATPLMRKVNHSNS